MKKNIIKLITVLAVFVSVNAFGQSNTQVLVKINSAVQPAALKTLSYGKMQGFSKEDKAMIVIPNDDTKETLAKLEAEIKAVLPNVEVSTRKKQ